MDILDEYTDLAEKVSLIKKAVKAEVRILRDWLTAEEVFEAIEAHNPELFESIELWYEDGLGDVESFVRELRDEEGLWFIPEHILIKIVRMRRDGVVHARRTVPISKRRAMVDQALRSFKKIGSTMSAGERSEVIARVAAEHGVSTGDLNRYIRTRKAGDSS